MQTEQCNRTQNTKNRLPCRKILQTKTVSGQALENQQVYIQQKICLRYFELSQTYFRLSPLYFQFAAGSFLPHEKKYFFS